MRNYELTYLISINLNENEAKQIHDALISLIQQEGGFLVKEKSPLKRKLAYPVKKQNQAYLAIINYQLLPEKLVNLEKKLKTENYILRYLNINLPALTQNKIIPSAAKISSKKTKPKVELKEIEKKLDEILNI